MTLEINVKKTVSEDDRHCSYMNKTDKCSWLSQSSVCRLFRIELKWDKDYFTSIKCAECKAACAEAVAS